MTKTASPLKRPSQPWRTALDRCAALLLAGILGLPLAPSAWAATTRTGTISGRALAPDGKAGMSGAVLKAVHIVSQRVYTSPASDAAGHFVLADLPPGYYDVGIEQGGQLFVAGSVINLPEGGKLNLDFILQPYGNKTSEWWQGQKREIPILGQEQGVAKVLEKSRAAPGGKSFWKKPGGIILISVAGVGVVAAAAGGGGGGGGDERSASPSNP